jgi:hypothetical protein
VNLGLSGQRTLENMEALHRVPFAHGGQGRSACPYFLCRMRAHSCQRLKRRGCGCILFSYYMPSGRTGTGMSKLPNAMMPTTAPPTATTPRPMARALPAVETNMSAVSCRAL